MLTEIVYTSTATASLSADQTQELLSVARYFNMRIGITGILLFQGGTFLQVLEGHPDTVRWLFEKISKDRRHTRVVKLLESTVTQRSFESWAMGYVALHSPKAREVPGFANYFGPNFSLAELQQRDNSSGSRVKQVLAGFRDGRWRRAVR
jgi:hypothetical protein